MLFGEVVVQFNKVDLLHTVLVLSNPNISTCLKIIFRFSLPYTASIWSKYCFMLPHIGPLVFCLKMAFFCSLILSIFSMDG